MRRMRVALPRLVALTASACWLLSGQQALAQGNTIIHTVVRNPAYGAITNPPPGAPAPLFTHEFGAPIYGRPPFTHSLPVDLNHDGIMDFRVDTDSGPTHGFYIEGSGSNSVWIQLTGGNDIGGFIRPLPAGVLITNDLPAEDDWWICSGDNKASFASYSFSGDIGLFRSQLAYAGLKFYVDGEPHFGWIKVQELSWLGGGIVYEYACETRPGVPIVAGQTATSSPGTLAFTAALSGANQDPDVVSPHSGTGTFSLARNTLLYELQLDYSFRPTAAGIFGPAAPGKDSGRLVARLGSFSISNVPPPLVLPDTRWPAFPGAVVYRGQIQLKPPQIIQLLSGHLYVNLASASLPRGELRGQIIPAYPAQLDATLNGRAAVPPNGSARQANASFVLTGSYLFHAIALDADFGARTIAAFGPARHPSPPHSPVFTLDTTASVVIPEWGIPGQPGAPGQILSSGALMLTDRQTAQLKCGELFLNISTEQYPRGELRGQILPADDDADGIPDYVESLIEQLRPHAPKRGPH
ncbi:MAG TPA: hypothetical protein DIC50_01305 [Verrucomicrobia subdivision 3 bacterium]|nr:hypothetical protein [Limisphaerales bacterium]